MDYTIARSKEPSFFQETASFGQNQIIDNSVLFDSQLEEIHGFEENDLFDWSDAFNTKSENPHLMVVSKEDNHELLTTAPTLKSLNPCSGLTGTYQDFQSSTPAMNSSTPGRTGKGLGKLELITSMIPFFQDMHSPYAVLAPGKALTSSSINGDTGASWAGKNLLFRGTIRSPGYCRQDRLEGLMIETNYKYGSLVAMMAKMNGRNGKGMQMEGHMTPILSDGGAKISRTGKSSTQGNGKGESHAEYKNS
ncbi:Hypothetical predicted protein [Olea europaea subsp. europaea]|uniref:Uncharacterized protein n=1 Tax=Olea europaea subsp. europaea TaxID=158383 RepID=A0A8S0VDH4_OLEEU|nr:Hypothetical predicted protein [Olea europaea subsp. europaea]